MHSSPAVELSSSVVVPHVLVEETGVAHLLPAQNNTALLLATTSPPTGNTRSEAAEDAWTVKCLGAPLMSRLAYAMGQSMATHMDCAMRGM